MRVVFHLKVALWACVLVSTLLISGCDSVPGPESLDGRPPVLSDFTYSPTNIVLGQLPAEQVIGDLVRIPLTLQVTAEDPDGDLKDVMYVVRSNRTGEDPVTAGLFEGQGSFRYTAETIVELPAAEIAVYPVLVYADDHEGRLSNMATGLIKFFGSGEPPVIDDVEAPETVQIPASGETTRFKVIATVSDPDGPENISKVVLRNVNQTEFALLDDGGSGSLSEDEVAGDGRFTITFQIDSTAPEGAYDFQVQAVDKASLESNAVDITITFVR